jgi:hypothetical protein
MAKKRIGRPATYRKRFALGLRVTENTKRDIEAAAKASGRTQSQEAERLIEQALVPYRVLEAMEATIKKIKTGGLDQAFREAGYTKTRAGPGGIEAWVRSDRLAERSGFIDPADAERFLNPDTAEKAQTGKRRKA